MRLFCLRKPEGCGREDMRDRHCIWRNPGNASRQFANGSARGFPGIFSISASFTIGDRAPPTICWARAPPREVERHGRLWAKISNQSCCPGEQPWTDHNEELSKCSVGDWKEYVTAMGKFTNLVTEAVHSLDMVRLHSTVLLAGLHAESGICLCNAHHHNRFRH